MKSGDNRITIELPKGLKLVAEQNIDPEYQNEIYVGIETPDGIWVCEGEWREVECPQRKAVNIQWDIDPEDDGGVELPNEITIPNDIEDEEAISDYISDITGFCHKGFELEECREDLDR